MKLILFLSWVIGSLGLLGPQCTYIGLRCQNDSTHLLERPDHDLVEAELCVFGRSHVHEDHVVVPAAAVGGRRVRSGSDPLGLRPARFGLHSIGFCHVESKSFIVPGRDTECSAETGTTG